MAAPELVRLNDPSPYQDDERGNRILARYALINVSPFLTSVQAQEEAHNLGMPRKNIGTLEGLPVRRVHLRNRMRQQVRVAEGSLELLAAYEFDVTAYTGYRGGPVVNTEFGAFEVVDSFIDLPVWKQEQAGWYFNTVRFNRRTAVRVRQGTPQGLDAINAQNDIARWTGYWFEIGTPGTERWYQLASGSIRQRPGSPDRFFLRFESPQPMFAVSASFLGASRGLPALTEYQTYAPTAAPDPGVGVLDQRTLGGIAPANALSWAGQL